MSHNDLNSQLKIDGSFNRLIENYCVKREAEKQEKTGEKLSEIHLKKEFSEKISKVLDMDELTRKEFADLVINNAVGNSSFKSLLQTKLDFSSRNITVKLEMKNKNYPSKENGIEITNVEVTVIIHTDVIELNTVIKEVQIPNEEALIWSNDYYKSVLRKITYLMVGPSKYETWTGNDEDAYLNLQKENMESDRFLVIRNKVKGPFRK